MPSYEELAPISRRDAERELLSGDSESIVRALLRLALHDPDPVWLENKLLHWLDRSEDFWVRRAAIVGLGHVARLHRSLDLERVLRAFDRIAHESELTGAVEDAMEDFEVFLGSRR